MHKRVAAWKSRRCWVDRRALLLEPAGTHPDRLTQWLRLLQDFSAEFPSPTKLETTIAQGQPFASVYRPIHTVSLVYSCCSGSTVYPTLSDSVSMPRCVASKSRNDIVRPDSSLYGLAFALTSPAVRLFNSI
jgi:hypothetical protein